MGCQGCWWPPRKTQPTAPASCDGRGRRTLCASPGATAAGRFLPSQQALGFDPAPRLPDGACLAPSRPPLQPAGGLAAAICRLDRMAAQEGGLAACRGLCPAVRGCPRAALRPHLAVCAAQGPRRKPTCLHSLSTPVALRPSASDGGPGRRRFSRRVAVCWCKEGLRA